MFFKKLPPQDHEFRGVADSRYELEVVWIETLFQLIRLFSTTRSG